MGERYSRHEKTGLRGRLLRVNLRRILYMSACTAIILPILLLVYKLLPLDEELASTITGLLLGYEAVTIITAVLAFVVFRSKDESFAKVITMTYWAMFMGFSFVLMYFDAMTGNGMFYYCIMLAVLAFVPILSKTELMYFSVVQLLYTTFLMIKYGMTPKSIADIVIMNVVFIVISRIAYKYQLELFRMKEKSKGMQKRVPADPMTGLLNRSGFEHKAMEEILPAIKGRQRVSVLMIDIDRLKAYNEDFGSTQGDNRIREIADVIKRSSTRYSDTICRVSGGRFMVLTTGGGDMEIVTLAEKIRLNVERMHIQSRYGRSGQFMTVSVGVASQVLRSEQSFAELCDEAETSMIEAKEHGRNIVVFEEQIFSKKRMSEAI